MQKFIRHNARLLARNVVTNTICKLCKKSNDRLFLVVDSETLSERLSVKTFQWEFPIEARVSMIIESRMNEMPFTQCRLCCTMGFSQLKFSGVFTMWRTHCETHMVNIAAPVLRRPDCILCIAIITRSLDVLQSQCITNCDLQIREPQMPIHIMRITNCDSQ